MAFIQRERKKSSCFLLCMSTFQLVPGITCSGLYICNFMVTTESELRNKKEDSYDLKYTFHLSPRRGCVPSLQVNIFGLRRSLQQNENSS